MPNITDIAILPIDRLIKPGMGTSRLSVSKAIEERARALLESHPHFRGRTRWVHCKCRNRRLCLSGKVPSYYLKQLAQEAVRDIEGVDAIINQIVVGSPVWQIDKSIQNDKASLPSWKTTGGIKAR